MAGASILLGVLAFVAMVGGALGVVLPYYLGTVFSALSLVFALAGMVTGGLGISRAKRDGESTTLPIAGLVTSIVAFLFGMLVFLTCGLCNACVSAGGGLKNMQRVPLDGGGFYYTNRPGDPPPSFEQLAPPPPSEPSEIPTAPPVSPEPAAPPPTS